MGSDDTRIYKKMIVKINRQKDDNDDESAEIIFEKVDKGKDLVIDLSDSSVDDIKNLFDAVFNNIYLSKNLIEFELVDKGSDVYFEVSKEVVSQLNSEIEGSEVHFEEIWNLTDESQ